ncbi:3-hydroxyacyl-CoA dehydrogenase NAD-binding domain-containing protein [Mesorhizobium ciceri]|uniref:3-hydroxyacyl-CoA dehydrogenase NAD-binding domain-containing protein n=2 Tax=Mesorhizobium TaxID=68287 RepID=UPI000A5EF966
MVQEDLMPPRAKEVRAASVMPGVGLLLIEAPPLNVLATPIIARLAAELDRLERDPKVHSIVIVGVGKHFSAGADIEMLDVDKVPPGLSVRAFVERLGRCGKFVIAAIEGICLGGGLEIAMACDLRVVAQPATLGLPEIKLGLIPGAGGTQRLPRLIGIDNACALITSGESITGLQAAQLGLADIVDESPLERALFIAGETTARPKARTSDRSVATPVGNFVPSKRVQPGFAVKKATEAIEAARSLDFDRGLQREAHNFSLCLQSPAAQGLIYLFKAERQGRSAEAAKPTIPSQVAVIGGGAMGRGITLAFLGAGLSVTVVEQDAERLAHSKQLFDEHFETSVRRGRLSAQARQQFDERLAFSHQLEAAAAADFVVEAIVENMAAKCALFANLVRICSSDVILASNTSSLDIDLIADNVPNPERVVGLHFFSPANVMRLVEIVVGRRTDDAVVATCMEIAKRLRKVAVTVKVGPGFAANRMLAAYLRQATLLLEEGAEPQDVDAALHQFGFAMGPFAVYDLSGNDVALNMAQENPTLAREAGRPTPLLARVVALGRLGQKSGLGWYRYENGSREPLPDTEISELLAQRADEMGIARRAISKREIRARCLHAIVNEACRIMEEGLVERGSDIDVIWTSGFGFPKELGGPLFWADRFGLAGLVSEMEYLFDKSGVVPATLLLRAMNERIALSTWTRRK